MSRKKRGSIHDMGLDQEDELTKSIAKNLEESKPDVDIPNGYIPIQLCSNGKLSVPKTLHIKNFSTDDILEISTQMESFMKESTLKILQKNIFEEINIMDLTEYEIQQILFIIYVNWYSANLHGYNYEPSEEELNYLKENQEQLYQSYMEGKHKFEIDIPLNKVKVLDLPESFKEPFAIKKKDSDFNVEFRLPRMSDVVTVEKYFMNKYYAQYMDMRELEVKLSNEIESGKVNNNISYEQRKEFQEFQEFMAIESMKLIMKMSLVKVQEEELLTIEDKLKHANEIDFNYWKMYSKYTEEKLVWGLQKEVEVTSPITGKKVTKRFPFESVDLLQGILTSDVDEDDFEIG